MIVISCVDNLENMIIYFRLKRKKHTYDIRMKIYSNTGVDDKSKDTQRVNRFSITI